jgi:UDP-N-acetyl-D-mannosaminuronic acid dehydrogenase
MHELVTNHRVIGGMTPECSKAACMFYKLAMQGDCIITDTRTAEMCKLAENSFRDVNIAFANELSVICDKQGINVWELIKAANRHPRVNILQPGCGVGGHCIAVDPWFIINSAPDDTKLIRAAREVNDAKPGWVVHKVGQAVTELASSGVALQDIRIACLGIAYKADTDDLRESPAIQIIRTLAECHQGKIIIADPYFQSAPDGLADTRVTFAGLHEAMSQAHVLVLLIDHMEFKNVEPNLNNIQRLIDTRGIWN